jgi:hypothetical protein
VIVVAVFYKIAIVGLLMRGVKEVEQIAVNTESGSHLTTKIANPIAIEETIYVYLTRKELNGN